MAHTDRQAYFQTVKKQDWQSAEDVPLQLAKTKKNNPQIYLKINDKCQRKGEKAAIAVYAHASQILRMQVLPRRLLQPTLH